MPAVRQLASSRLARGLGAMIAGGALGQGLVVAASPFLTRLYTPTDFGSFAVFTALVLTTSVVATLRLETAVVLPERDEDAAAIAWVALTAAAVASGIVALAGLALAPALTRALGAPALAALWGLIPLTMLLIATFQVLSGWILREQRYGALGLRNLAQGVGTAGVQLGLGATGVGALGLLLGQAAGYLTALGGLTSRRGLLRQPRPDLAAMKHVLIRYRRFPLISSWSALLNTAGLQVPLLVISAVYGQVVVGLLGLTMRVLVAPLALLGRNVAQVFLGEVSAGTRTSGGSLERRLRSTSLALLAVGVVPTGVLVVSGPWLFGVVFGPQWVEAGEYGRLLAVGFLAQFVVSPISQTLLVLERQGTQLLWDVGRVALTVGAPLCAARLGADADVAIALLSGCLVVTYSVLYVTCRRAARLEDARDVASGAAPADGAPEARTAPESTPAPPHPATTRRNQRR